MDFDNYLLRLSEIECPESDLFELRQRIKQLDVRKLGQEVSKIDMQIADLQSSFVDSQLITFTGNKSY
jgi:hypothetical protein